MKLTPLAKDKYHVLAIEHSQAVEDFLDNQVPANMQGSAAGFRALFTIYSKRGKNGLSRNSFHHADVNENLYEFIKGRIRVYCFMDGDQCILLTNAAIKKSQKPAKKDIELCKRLRDDYFAAKAAHQLVYKS